MFKTAFATALIAAYAIADNVHDDAKVAGLVEGFFIGAFDFHGMTDIGHCISDANPVEQHFENAMRLEVVTALIKSSPTLTALQQP